MRLLLVAQPTAGGTAVVMRELAAGAVALGHRVTVATPDADGTREWAASAGVEWVGLPLRRAPTASDAARVRDLRRLMGRADVVHLHSSKAGAVGRIAARSLREPPRIVFTPHAWSWYVGGRLGPAYRRFERWAARVTDVVTVVSDEERDDGRGVLGPAVPITVIENGVDVARFAPDGPQAARADAPLLVCVGRLCEQKGQDRLIRVLARLPDPATRLRLVGDGPDRPVLERLAADLGVGPRVEFAGATDPRPHLRAADVVVLPSRWEGMSLVLLEAMACGAAVVTTAVGGASAVGDGSDRTGVVVPDGPDPVVERAVGNAVAGLLADPIRKAELGRRARSRAVARHDFALRLAAYDAVWSAGRSGPDSRLGRIRP